MQQVTRRVLKDITTGFVGWAKIGSLAKECMNNQYYAKPSSMFPDKLREKMRLEKQLRDRDLVSTIFLTGGRISEVLMAQERNFIVEEDFIFVHSFPLLKRYEWIKEVKETRINPPSNEEIAQAKLLGERWFWNSNEGFFERYKKETKPVIKERSEFLIPRWEPLSEYLIERISKSETWLFSTSHDLDYLTGSVGVQKWITDKFQESTRKWISPQRAFQIVSKTSERANLHVEPDREGVKKVGVWDHWIRSQRASQLARDYEFNDNHLNGFFGWVEPRDIGTARRYTKVGATGLEDQMTENKARHERLLKRDYRRAELA